MAKTEHTSVQVEYMHLCDYAFQSDRGKPGIIGIFDSITCPSFPSGHPLMCIAVQLRGQAGHVVPIRLVLEAPNGEKLVDLPEQQVTLSPAGSAFINANLMGVPLKSPGRYSVLVMSQGAVLASVTMKVVKAEVRAA